MARPSTQTDQKLLAMGRKHFSRYGVCGLSVRKIAREAHINLGMFNYHFGTKEKFIRTLLQQEYEKFFSALQAEFLSKTNKEHPRDQLRSLLKVFAGFIFKHRDFVAALIKDLVSGEKIPLEFARKNVPRHIRLILGVIENGQKNGEIRQDLPKEQILILCLSTLGPPIVLGEALSRLKIKEINGTAKNMFFSEEQIDARIEFLIKGLTP